MTMESIRKWFYRPKRDDKSLLAQFFFADEDLNMIASELDSFDGRKDPERCTTLVNMLRQSQDRVLTITNSIMDVLIPNERANRDFRVKFPEDVLQENLAGQLWFGAECLAAGSSIMNREAESAAMRPLAKALTKSLENVRNLLREACLRNNTPNGPLRLPNNEFICESLKIFDKIFAEFELRYVSAMVPVKTTQEYELQELIGVLFSETLQRALKMKLLTQEQVDDYDPALMFTIPRLAIVSGLLIYPNGPLCIDKPEDQMSEMFRPFKTLLHKIRELLWTLNKRELYMLEKLLCDNEQISDFKSVSEVNTDSHSDLDDFVNRFYNDYPLCKDYVSSFLTVTTTNNSEIDADFANEAAEEIDPNDLLYLNKTPTKLLEPESSPQQVPESLYPDYETISDSSLPPIDVIPQTPVEELEALTNSFTSLPEIATPHDNLPPLDEIISNAIAVTSVMSTSSTNNEISDIVEMKENHHTSSENIEIPSTSGYLLANTVEHDNIMASLSTTADQSPQRGESLPDRDCLETISAATATLSTYLTNATNEDMPTENCFIKPEERKDDCLYCGEIKEEQNSKRILRKNDVYLDSPGMDSGISTENTSLDRSPSLDLITNESQHRGDNKKESNNDLKTTYSVMTHCNRKDLSSNPSSVTSVIPCQYSIENSSSGSRSLVKNIEINYTETNTLNKNENCDVLKFDRTNSNNNNNNNDLSPSTSKQQQCISNSSPHVRRRGNVTPRHRKRSHQQRTTAGCGGSGGGALTPTAAKSNSNSIIVSSTTLMMTNGYGNSKDTLNIPPATIIQPDNLSVCSSETSTFDSDCADDEEIALAMQAAEIANRNEVRAKFRSTEDLLHRLFVCIAGVADQLQTNYASDLRNILKAVFLMNASDTTAETNEITSSQTNNTNDTINTADSIEYRASESDIILPNNEFPMDPNILAQEALFDTNVYFQIDENNQQTSQQNSETSPCVTTTTNDNLQQYGGASSIHTNPATTIHHHVTSNGGSTGDIVVMDDRPPIWIPDVQAPKCMSCEANFTVVKRRHHCRNCGKVFCARCSANSVPLPKFGHHKPVRVCNKCFMYHLTPFTM